MLRKTVAKAFGSGEPEAAPVARAAHETRRGEAVERLFSSLNEAFQAALPEERSGLQEPEPTGALDGTSWLPGQLELDPPRPRSGGFELTLRGQACAFTFLNSLSGYITVLLGGSAVDGVPLEVLGVQLQGGVFRPIRKPILSGPKQGVSAHARRSGFRFTSVPEVAREYLARARGIQEVDTSGGLT